MQHERGDLLTMPGEAWDERRFARMEDDLKSTALAMVRLGDQITSLRLELPNQFMPRRESDMASATMSERLNKLEENQSKALWLVLADHDTEDRMAVAEHAFRYDRRRE